MTEAISGAPTDSISTTPNPFHVEAPSPRGPEMVFHDPLSHYLPSRMQTSLHASPKPNRIALKRAGTRKPATRAAAIEAVSQELKLLARSKESPAG